MKKKYFLGIIILIGIIYPVTIEREVTLYLDIANPSTDIDLTIKLDNIEIYNDTLSYDPFQFKVIKFNIKGVLHNLEVHSNMIELTKSERLIFLFRNHLLIAYYPPTELLEEKANFVIYRSFKSFHTM